MVNEHYVPESYLRLFAPPGEGYISRYSLVEKHGGGDYRPARNQYPVKKAASTESYANGWLESDQTNKIEQAHIESIRRLLNDQPLGPNDIAHLSQFVALQFSRTPQSKLHFEGRQWLKEADTDFQEIADFDLDQTWSQTLSENVKDGYESFQYMGWRVIENSTDVPFISSDNPVVQYFEANFENVTSPEYGFEHREIFCPLGPDHCLVMLDPSRFDVKAQAPNTNISKRAITDRKEIHKVNLLHVVTAFQEIFGPAGSGKYLELLVEKLCDAFPHPYFIRGNMPSMEVIELTQRIGAGGYRTREELEWYWNQGREVTIGRRVKSLAVWEYSHCINFVDQLRRKRPREDYWDQLELDYPDVQQQTTG